MSAGYLLQATGWLFAGAALGGVYLYLIARSLAAIHAASAWYAAALYLALRIGLAVAAFALAAMSGAAALLLMLAGFLLARTVVIRRVRVG